VLIDTDLLKTATSANPKPEVKLRRSGRHLDNQFNIIISAEDGPLWTKFGSLMHNSAADCQISVKFCVVKQFFFTEYPRSTEPIFFVFLMQFGLWRAAALVSSPKHLFDVDKYCDLGIWVT